jgi:hypothetical protein
LLSSLTIYFNMHKKHKFETALKGKQRGFESFFVGLFDGDGSLHMCKTKPGKTTLPMSYPVAQIKLKRNGPNQALLGHVRDFYGGNLTYEKSKLHEDKVVWVASSQKAIAKIFRCFEKYPLLTSRKICQLRHAQACLQNRSWQYHLQHRDNKYLMQPALVEHFKQCFVAPSYFPFWLSGFYEAEGSFNFTHRFRVYISQDHDWYLINAIKQYFKSHHKIGLHKDKRYRAPSVHYRLSISGKPVLKNILAHFERYPLLGFKAISYAAFADKFLEKHPF